MIRKLGFAALLLALPAAALIGFGVETRGEGAGEPPAPGRSEPATAGLAPLEVELDPAQMDLVRRLDQPATAAFRKTPLQQALTSLGRQTGVSFVLDAEALEQARIDAAEPVEGRFEKTPLFRAVERLLHPFGLEMCLSGEAILITDVATARQQVWTRSYPVVDVAVVATDKRPQFLGRELVELIQDVVEPESWDDMDGPCFVTFETINFSLIATQSLRGHKSIERLLGALRQGRGRLEEICRRKLAPTPQDLFSSYFSPPQELRRMYETLVLLEEGASPGIVGWSSTASSDRLIPAAARRLAAKALAFAAEVEEDLEAEALDKDGAKEPIPVRAPALHQRAARSDHPAAVRRRTSDERGRLEERQDVHRKANLDRFIGGAAR